MGQFLANLSAFVTKGEKCLVFIREINREALDAHVLPSIAVGDEDGVRRSVFIATESQQFFEKIMAIPGGDIVFLDFATIKFEEFDRFFVVDQNCAARYFLEIIERGRVSPTRIYLSNMILGGEHNLIYRKNNLWNNFVDSAIEGGFNTANGVTLLSHIYDCVERLKVSNIPGDIVNLGVWKGWSMKFFLNLLDHFQMDKRVIGFDTFDGFVVSDRNDVQSLTQDGRAVSEKFKGVRVEDVEGNLRPYANYRLVKGDASQTVKDFKFENGICLALFDMDDYTPTIRTLPVIFDNLATGGFILHDHYNVPSCQVAAIGQRIAMDEFLSKTYMLNLSGTNVFQKA